MLWKKKMKNIKIKTRNCKITLIALNFFFLPVADISSEIAKLRLFYDSHFVTVLWSQRNRIYDLHSFGSKITFETGESVAIIMVRKKYVISQTRQFMTVLWSFFREFTVTEFRPMSKSYALTELMLCNVKNFQSIKSIAVIALVKLYDIHNFLIYGSPMTIILWLYCKITEK